MEIFVLLIIGFVIWRLVKGSKNTKDVPSGSTNKQGGDLQITVTTSMGRGSRLNSESPADTGALTAAEDSGWVLNPKSPLPLTVLGATKQQAEKLKSILDSSEYWSNKSPAVAYLIAQHNLRFQEVDEFIAQYRGRFESKIAQLISGSAEWQSSSDLDKEDLRAEFAEKALEDLGVFVGRADLGVLLADAPNDIDADDALLKRFEGDAELYAFYLGRLGRKSDVVTVKADEYWRKDWERLVDKGFARRGKDVAIEAILESLRLKDMNEILGASEKPFGRKAKAIEALLALPDLEQRLSSSVSFREIFQVVEPEGIDVSKLTASFSYAGEVATLVLQTYSTGTSTLQTVEERKQEKGIYDAWEIECWEDPMPKCAVPFCKKYSRTPAKLPPFHVGCTCNLENSFKDA